MHKQFRNMIYLLSFLALLYGLLVVGMYTFQRKLMYLPSKHIDAPRNYGLEGFSDMRAKTSDGVTVQLWYHPAENNMPTIVYFHGNAAHLGNRAGKFAAFAHDGFGVLALGYRGYGASEGEPTEQGLYSDARAAIAYATKENNIPLTKIMLYGESLGSGVAVQMATEYKVGALLLEAPYTSVVNRAAEIYFFVPVKFLIHDHYDSISKISTVKMPVLIFHGEQDITIPLAHGKAILAAANEPKKAYFFPHIGHTDFDSGLISTHVVEFAHEHKLNN
jgi:fermentation-respiration switch protein FrsA (DUF1100 family)